MVLVGPPRVSRTKAKDLEWSGEEGETPVATSPKSRRGGVREYAALESVAEPSGALPETLNIAPVR